MPGYELVFQLWLDTGLPTLEKLTNLIASVPLPLETLWDIGECVNFVNYQAKMGKQPNGQPENLIASLSIQPTKS